MPIGRAIGKLMLLLSPKRRQIAYTNLSRCFPEFNEEQLEEVLKKNFDHLGLMFVDMGTSWFASPAKLRSICEVEGFHHLTNALENGKGVLMLMSHQTSMEIGGQILALELAEIGHPIQVMYKETKNPMMETLVRRGRGRFTNQTILHSDMRSMIRGLKKGVPAWYAPDQDFGGNRSLFADFFGFKTATVPMTSKLASTTKVPVVPCFVSRSEDGRKIHVRCDAPLENYPSDDAVADANLTNKVLEDEIKKYPEQYFWVHRRFKTRPEGETPFYDV